MAMESESGFQDIYLLIFLFALVANRSMSAWPNYFVMKENASFESVYSVVSLNCLDFFVYFSIILPRYMGSSDPDSLHFSPFPDLLCYFMACNGSRTTHIIYISNCSCTVTHNSNMLTQEISLK